MAASNVFARALADRRIAVMVFLGFSSGLPLALTSGTLQAWLTQSGLSISVIGWFSLVGWAYTLKFLWSPLMDRFVPPWLGRRRGWSAATQLGLIIGLVLLGCTAPIAHPELVFVVAMCVVFLSASQDISLDAYRTDVLEPQQRGIGAAVWVGGYRIGMLVSGALALVLADQIGWHATYFVMAGVMLVGLITTFLAPEPRNPAEPPSTLSDAIVKPFKEFWSRGGALPLLTLIVLYKLGDASAGTLTTAFLLRGLELTATEVGLINKAFGFAAVMAGLLFGGAIMVRLGLFWSLLVFGCLQAVTNLGFLLLSLIGKSYWALAAVIGLENLTGGMGTAAFVALLMALCDRRYTATQFALLSSLGAVGRVFVGPPSGYWVEAVGWSWFFLGTFVVALPGLLLLVALRARLEKADEGRDTV